MEMNELTAKDAKALYNSSEKVISSINVANIILKQLYDRIAASAKDGKCETSIVYGYEHLDDLFFNSGFSQEHKHADTSLVQNIVVGKLMSLGYSVRKDLGTSKNEGIVEISWKDAN